MFFPRRSLSFYILAAGLVLLAAAGGGFFLRAPVLVVTDASFEALYGAARGRLKQVEASLRLFRRVLPVVVAENAGGGLVAIAVGEAAAAPYAVVFPYRYADAARSYREEHPGVAAVVLGGRAAGARGLEGAVVTDTALDFYRAGLCAALLTGEGGGEILVCQTEVLDTATREAFRAGLAAGGVSREPRYLRAEEEVASWDTVACAVVTGTGVRFFEKNPATPCVLFSWVDPAVTPRAVRVIFDDSPWAQVVEAVRLARGGAAGALPSEIAVPVGREAGGDVAGLLRGVSRRAPASGGAGA